MPTGLSGASALASAAAAPTSEQLALWAAEELWDWHVRTLFALVCVVAVVSAIVVYVACGHERNRGADSSGRARRYLGRIAVALAVVGGAESMFFRDSATTLLIAATAAIIGFVGLRMPAGDGAQAVAPDDVPPGDGTQAKS
ncbi:MAG TPA: hypothetical protein DCP91_07905 [Eggerthellaceae bacterium]|nr:hypothetical protein [Eggerthellaceae bacterium]